MTGHEEEIFSKLLAAFREDHVMLGRGFNELSCCLRAGDSLGAARAAHRVYEEAGPHICFEEEDFYPALVPLVGEKAVRKMRQEHCCGLDAVRTLLNRDPNLPVPADLSERLLAQSEVMEAHIAECGELFAALHHIPSTDQQVLYDKLMKWRREQPKLDLDRRTVGCGALRLVQCHPAALPLDASSRSSLPVLEQLTVRIGPEERREVARLASRLIADEPALIANDTLDPRTGSGIADGPALFFEDQSAIALRRSAPFGLPLPAAWRATATSWRSADSATPNSKPTAAICSDSVIPRSSCRLAFLICPWHSAAPAIRS